MKRPIALLSCIALWASAAQALEPQTHWQLQCMGCHHPDGAGEKGRVPSLRETLIPFASLEEGRRFMIQVPGVAQSTLDDADVAKLLNWMVLNLGSTPAPPDFVAFSTAEVAAARREPLPAVKARREWLLGRIAAGATGTPPHP